MVDLIQLKNYSIFSELLITLTILSTQKNGEIIDSNLNGGLENMTGIGQAKVKINALVGWINLKGKIALGTVS